MRILTILALLLIVTAAAADNTDSSLTAFGGLRTGGSVDIEDGTASYDFDDSSSFGLIWNHRHDANTEWELLISRQDTEAELSNPALADPVVDVELTTVELGGTYLWDGDKVVPYLVATMGATHARADTSGGQNNTFFSGSIGLGLKMFPESRLGLRLEARAHGMLIRDNTKLFCESGPAANACAVELQGELFSQIQAFAGFSFRF